MRVRRERAPLLGFSLALPPPDMADEMQVKQKNELFISVDDASVSPMITTNEQLFPACFFHVNNTNLFVLMDGVSMFTEGKLAHREEASQVKPLEEKMDGNVVTRKAMTKSLHQKIGTAVDSVEAAIRGIEGGGFSFAGLTNVTTSGVLAAKENAGCSADLCWKTAVSSGTTTNAPTVAMKRTKSPISAKGVATVPKEYVALFANNVDPLPAVLKAKIFCDSRALKLRGFMPFVVSGKNGFAEPKLNAPMTNDLGMTVLSVPKKNSASSTVSVGSEKMKQSLVEKNVKDKLFHSGKRFSNKRFFVNEIGRSNTVLNLDAVEILSFIGKGTQGTVHCVMLDNKVYALKCIDLKEVTEATNAVERQGRKLGLVKELNMIRLQRLRNRPKNLMQVFNAVATLDSDVQQLYILMELMSFSVEDAQKMVSRFPVDEMMKMTQSTFSKHLAGSAAVHKEKEELAKHWARVCVKLTGRNSYNVPEEWENSIDRQTPMPEIVLSMLAADLLNGLKELHDEYSIVHCDLKPANVLLDFDMTCFKIADFGCGCQMDKNSYVVRRTSVDLGSKLYKAPERLRNEPTCAEMEDGASAVEFTAAADVWSLGIMLLELRSGVHPCYSFKSDYWNYVNNLKLSRMIKPLTWSAAFCDFILRCLVRNPSARSTVEALLEHPFILRYSAVPREKLRTFMKRLKSESQTFQQRRQRELLLKQIWLSTGEESWDKFRNKSRSRWRSFTGFLTVAPQFEDQEKFPQLI